MEPQKPTSECDDFDDPVFAELLMAARSGSTEALVELISLAREKLLRVARRAYPAAVQAKVGASDIVQETVVDAYLGFGRFEGHSPAQFYGWLRGILRHKLADTLRQHSQAQRRSVCNEVRMSDLDAAGNGVAEPAELSPHFSAIRSEEAKAVFAALGEIPPVMKEVILLRHWRGRPFAQIAQEVGKTEAAVRKIWHRGIRKLSEIMRSGSILPPDNSTPAPRDDT